jgi:pimeloyl-ACP methyl ester carboxylesterase
MTWDRGEGAPLLLIHGVGASHALWQTDRADLAGLGTGCSVVVYDRCGDGSSAESPREPAVVVGSGGGAMIALDLVLQRPKLVSEPVLLDPAANIKRCSGSGLIGHMLTASLLNRLGRQRRGAEHWMRYVSSYPSGGSGFDRSPVERRATLLDNAAGILADADAGRGDVAEKRLASIDTPTTIVDCRLSPSFLRRSCERLRELTPQTRTVTFELSSHHVSIDARDELPALLRGMVARPGDPSAPAATA